MRAGQSTYVQIYIVGQYLPSIHGKFGGGTISELRATKRFLVHHCNVCIVEFSFGYNFSHIIVSMLEPNPCIHKSMFLVDFLIILGSESARFSCNNAQVNFHQNILSRNLKDIESYLWGMCTTLMSY